MILGRQTHFFTAWLSVLELGRVLRVIVVRRCFGAVATNVYQRIKVEEKREEASLIISMGKLINNNQGCKYITYLYNSVQLNATLLLILKLKFVMVIYTYNEKETNV